MPQLTLNNNISLYYEQHGSGEDLVLIGGLTSDHQVWKSTLRLFSKHFRVLIFDNRGAGRSSTPDVPYTLEMMAQDTLQLMDALHISRAHILGHSMGGGIAQQIALLAPEKINKLVIACTRSKQNALANMVFSMREKLHFMGVTNDVLAEYVMPFLFGDEFLNNPLLVKGFIQWTLRNPFPQTEMGYKHQLHAVKTHDFSEQLHQITTPTLVIAGEEDILAKPKQIAQLSQSLKNSTFVTIPNCAHMPHVERSKEFAEVVLRFFEE
jgi:pimeloyl-ACP methyl ester carboxylesterase